MGLRVKLFECRRPYTLLLFLKTEKYSFVLSVMSSLNNTHYFYYNYIYAKPFLGDYYSLLYLRLPSTLYYMECLSSLHSLQLRLFTIIGLFYQSVLITA